MDKITNYCCTNVATLDGQILPLKQLKTRFAALVPSSRYGSERGSQSPLNSTVMASIASDDKYTVWRNLQLVDRPDSSV